jgi:hypothetical protein
MPTLEELNEEEGSDLERLCQGVLPNDEPCDYRATVHYPTCKRRSATHTLRRKAFKFVELNVTVGSVKETCLHRPSCDVMRRIRPF